MTEKEKEYLKDALIFYRKRMMDLYQKGDRKEARLVQERIIGMKEALKILGHEELIKGL